MDISFFYDHLCIIKLSDGKEYNCLKFDNLKHCDDVLRTVGMMTPDLVKTSFFFSIKNVLNIYEKGLAFMLDDDAPVKLLALKNEEITTLVNRGYLDYSPKTMAAVTFLMKHFDATSNPGTETKAREEEISQAVSMEGVEMTTNVQLEQTHAPTLMLTPDKRQHGLTGDQQLQVVPHEKEQQQRGPNPFESSTEMEVDQPLAAECDPSDDTEADSTLDEKLPAVALAEKKSAEAKKTPIKSKAKKTNGSAKANKKSASKQSRKSPPSAAAASEALHDSNVSNTQEEKSLDQDPPNTSRSSRAGRPSSSKKNDVVTPLSKNMAKSSKKPSRESTPLDEEVVWNTDPLTFNDFKPALEQAGFKFTKGCFALPNKHPSVYKEAKLGRDYFESEYEFRKHLCAFGMDDCKAWDSETRELLNIWVRYHIVDYTDRLPNIDSSKKHNMWKIRNIWKTLTRIGFVYRNNHLGARYCFPGDGGIEFNSEATCLEYIARYGFPDSCAFTSMTDVDRVRLQMVVAESDRAKTL